MRLELVFFGTALKYRLWLHICKGDLSLQLWLSVPTFNAGYAITTAVSLYYMNLVCEYPVNIHLLLVYAPLFILLTSDFSD